MTPETDEVAMDLANASWHRETALGYAIRIVEGLNRGGTAWVPSPGDTYLTDLAEVFRKYMDGEAIPVTPEPMATPEPTVDPGPQPVA